MFHVLNGNTLLIVTARNYSPKVNELLRDIAVRCVIILPDSQIKQMCKNLLIEYNGDSI
jgi:hypothetical protein